MKEIDDMVNKYIRESLKGIDLSDDFLIFFAVFLNITMIYIDICR